MTELTQNKKNKLFIVLIIVVFCSPIIFSWLALKTDIVSIRGTSNKGELITPPRPIQDIALIEPLNDQRQDSMHGKWSMVYVARRCDQVCMDNVYRMRQLHIAMDKHSLRVQKVLLLTEQTPQSMIDQLTSFAGQQFMDLSNVNVDELINTFRFSEGEDPFNQHRLYIVDPMGNLMMRYQPDVNPRDIMKDLKKLLKFSRIG